MCSFHIIYLFCLKKNGGAFFKFQRDNSLKLTCVELFHCTGSGPPTGFWAIPGHKFGPFQPTGFGAYSDHTINHNLQAMRWKMPRARPKLAAQLPIATVPQRFPWRCKRKQAGKQNQNNCTSTLRSSFFFKKRRQNEPQACCRTIEGHFFSEKKSWNHNNNNNNDSSKSLSLILGPFELVKTIQKSSIRVFLCGFSWFPWPSAVFMGFHGGFRVFFPVFFVWFLVVRNCETPYSLPQRFQSLTSVGQGLPAQPAVNRRARQSKSVGSSLSKKTTTRDWCS